MLQDTRLNGGPVQRVGQFRELLLERRTHEVVAVVHDERDAGVIFFIHLARILRRNNHRALNLAVTHILHRFFVVVVVDGHEGPNIGADGIEGFTNLQSLWPAVLIDDADSGVANLATEGVAQNDELHQGKYHRRQHERGRTEELAHLALDNGHHPVHTIHSVPFTAVSPAAAAW